MIRKSYSTSSALLGALVVVSVLSLLAGRVWLAPSSWFEADGLPALIILELRLPRLCLGLCIGAGLGMAGAVMQGYLRNPLADPGLFGISSSAALGAVTALYLGAGVLGASMATLLPLFALFGAGLGMVLLTILAGRTASVVIFTLAGVILASLGGSLTALLISLAPSPFATTEILHWLMGALTDRSWADVALAAPLIALGMVILLFVGRSLDALTLGSEAAQSLGVDMRRLQIAVVLGVGLCVGASVAVAGVIAFVGLIVPHLVRPLVGHRPSALLIPSALAGALLVVGADSLVRLLPSASELRLNIAMSLLGAPFFLAMLFKMRREIS